MELNASLFDYLSLHFMSLKWQTAFTCGVFYACTISLHNRFPSMQLRSNTLTFDKIQQMPRKYFKLFLLHKKA